MPRIAITEPETVSVNAGTGVQSNFSITKAACPPKMITKDKTSPTKIARYRPNHDSANQHQGSASTGYR